MDSPRTIYERVMHGKRNGIPNYHPDCNENLPLEARKRGTSVGDVGFRKDGGFNYLFNITLPSDHPVNEGRVPNGFVPVTVNKDTDVSTFSNHYSTPTVIYSSSVTNCEFAASAGVEPPVLSGIIGANFRIKFTRGNSEGAILILPNGGSRQDILAVGRLKTYIEKHAERWFPFFTDYEVDELFLVTGCDKASAWGIATFSEATGSFETSILFEAAAIGAVNGGVRYSWTATSTDCRTGPGVMNEFGKDCQNQCIFIRGLRISLRRDSATSWLAGTVKIVDESDPSRPPLKSRSHMGRSRHATAPPSAFTFRLPVKLLSNQPQLPETSSKRFEIVDHDRGHTEDVPKTKQAACQRCRYLKVRCENRTDKNPCKRCTSADHKCVTPEKRNRRQPPKRQHLIEQIRQGAAVIQMLMSRLEESDKQPLDRESSGSKLPASSSSSTTPLKTFPKCSIPGRGRG